MSEKIQIDWLLVAMFMSPDGPEQAAYRAHLERATLDGMSVMRVSWGPDATKLACTYVGREGLFKTLNEINDEIAAGRTTLLDFKYLKWKECDDPLCGCHSNPRKGHQPEVQL